MCLFLALAITDGAFQGFKRIEALRGIQVPNWVDDLVLEYEPKVARQPFLLNDQGGHLFFNFF